MSSHNPRYEKESPRFTIRCATEVDLPHLHALIDASVRSLSTGDYTPAQMEGSIGSILGVDTQLIRDQTYFIAETLDAAGHNVIAGSGGWSYRKTLFGADEAPGRNPEAMDPASNAAKIRAIFVHPNFVRCGLGSLLLAHVEAAAYAAGFRQFEMGSTLTGYPLYLRKGYREIERNSIPLHNGEVLPIVRMVKDLTG
jgi:GNAT superfamily N-acetyltransferase